MFKIAFNVVAVACMVLVAAATIDVIVDRRAAKAAQ